MWRELENLLSSFEKKGALEEVARIKDVLDLAKINGHKVETKVAAVPFVNPTDKQALNRVRMFVVLNPYKNDKIFGPKLTGTAGSAFEAIQTSSKKTVNIDAVTRDQMEQARTKDIENYKKKYPGYLENKNFISPENFENPYEIPVKKPKEKGKKSDVKEPYWNISNPYNFLSVAPRSKGTPSGAVSEERAEEFLTPDVGKMKKSLDKLVDYAIDSAFEKMSQCLNVMYYHATTKSGVGASQKAHPTDFVQNLPIPGYAKSGTPYRYRYVLYRYLIPAGGNVKEGRVAANVFNFLKKVLLQTVLNPDTSHLISYLIDNQSMPANTEWADFDKSLNQGFKDSIAKQCQKFNIDPATIKPEIENKARVRWYNAYIEEAFGGSDLIQKIRRVKTVQEKNKSTGEVADIATELYLSPQEIFFLCKPLIDAKKNGNFESWKNLKLKEASGGTTPPTTPTTTVPTQKENESELGNLFDDGSIEDVIKDSGNEFQDLTPQEIVDILKKKYTKPGTIPSTSDEVSEGVDKYAQCDTLEEMYMVDKFPAMARAYWFLDKYSKAKSKGVHYSLRTADLKPLISALRNNEKFLRLIRSCMIMNFGADANVLATPRSYFPQPAINTFGDVKQTVNLERCLNSNYYFLFPGFSNKTFTIKPETALQQSKDALKSIYENLDRGLFDRFVDPPSSPSSKTTSNESSEPIVEVDPESNDIDLLTRGSNKKIKKANIDDLFGDDFDIRDLEKEQTHVDQDAPKSQHPYLTPQGEIPAQMDWEREINRPGYNDEHTKELWDIVDSSSPAVTDYLKKAKETEDKMVGSEILESDVKADVKAVINNQISQTKPIEPEEETELPEEEVEEKVEEDLTPEKKDEEVTQEEVKEEPQIAPTVPKELSLDDAMNDFEDEDFGDEDFGDEEEGPNKLGRLLSHRIMEKIALNPILAQAVEDGDVLIMALDNGKIYTSVAAMLLDSPTSNPMGESLDIDIEADVQKMADELCAELEQSLSSLFSGTAPAPSIREMPQFNQEEMLAAASHVERLVKLANHLDNKGKNELADKIDRVIEKIQQIYGKQ